MWINRLKKLLLYILNVFIKKQTNDSGVEEARLNQKTYPYEKKDLLQTQIVQPKINIESSFIETKEEEKLIDNSSRINRSMAEDEKGKKILDESTSLKSDNEELLQKLLNELLSMKLGSYRGNKTKNKPLLILTLINLIEKKVIIKNEIYLNSILEDEFDSLANKVKTKNEVIRVYTPFYHLVNSSFWCHHRVEGKEEAYKKLADTYIHKSQIINIIEFAYISESYFPFFINKSSREIIKRTILKTFFNDNQITNLLSEQNPKDEHKITSINGNYSDENEILHGDIAISSIGDKGIKDQEIIDEHEGVIIPSMDSSLTQVLSPEEGILGNESIEKVNEVDLNRIVQIPREEIPEEISVGDNFQGSDLAGVIEILEECNSDIRCKPVDDLYLQDQSEIPATEYRNINQETETVNVDEEYIERAQPLMGPVFELHPGAFQKKKYKSHPQQKSRQTQKNRYFLYDIEKIPRIDNQELISFIEKIDKLSIDNFTADDIQKLEIHLLNAFERYEIIGELPFSHANFEYLCRLIQKKFTIHQKYNVSNVPPAIFIMSMVFCARYSEEDARKFWEPYSNRVWNTEPTQYFQGKCRKHFKDCRRFLVEKFGFDFSVIKEGDVVRPVYYQAEIPYYLQSSFASWLVNQFEKLLQYSIKDLPEILQNEASLDYVPKRLRDFIQQGETKDTAALLIQQMAKAVKLFQETEQFETVKSVMSSPIQQSLWEEIYEQLDSKKIELLKIRQYSSKFYWGWDFNDNDFYLRLAHVRSTKNEKPNLLIWADKGIKSLLNQEIIESIYPWQLSNGDWEIEPISLKKPGDFKGEIYILSEEFDLEASTDSQLEHVILNKQIPELSQPIIFFKADSTNSITKGKDHIDGDGEWIIICKENFDVLDQKEEILAFENRHIPEGIDYYGYGHVRKYSIHLPITIQTNETRYSFSIPQSATVLQNQLIGQDPIRGMSPNLSPIFRTPNVRIVFNGVLPQQELSKIWLSIHRGQSFVSSISLHDLLKQDLLNEAGNTFQIDLQSFLDSSGAYSFNLLHNLQSLIEDPIEFSYLPGFTCEGPNPEVIYSPINPVEIIASGIDCSQIKTYQEDKVKLDSVGDKIILRWKELKLSECRFSIQWEGNNIPLCWQIQRVSAWIDGESGKKDIAEADISTIVLHARGKPYEPLSWLVVDCAKRRDIQLDSKGEFNELLEQSVIRDMLKETKFAVSHVNAELRGMNWEVFTYKKKPGIEILSVDVEGAKLIIKLEQSEFLTGEYTVQVTSKDQNCLPIIINKYKQLQNKIEENVELVPGKYQIEILLYNELLASSKEFAKKGENKRLEEAKNQNELLLVNSSFTSTMLFDNLTISPARIKNYCNAETRTKFIPQIQQIICNHDLKLWITDEKLSDGLKQLLPSWAVLDFPLRFTSKDLGAPFYLFPQQLAFGFKYGKGYMRAKIDDQSVNLYAAWNSDYDQRYVNLWLMFPQQDNIRNYSELDECNMWPAYQCVNCGLVVGSREGSYIKLPPKIVVQHKHNKDNPIRNQFRDVVYGKHIKGTMSQYKEKPLIHTEDPHTIIGHNFLQDLENGKIKPIKGELSKPIPFNNSIAYYCAISELFENYRVIVLKNHVNQIMGEAKLFIAIHDYIRLYKGVTPAFSVMDRIIIQLSAHDQIEHFPKYALLIAIVLRLKGHIPEEYRQLLYRTHISEDKLINLTHQTYISCPKLLEWAIALADLFFIHAIS